MLVHSPPEIFGNTNRNFWLNRKRPNSPNANMSDLNGRKLLNDFTGALPCCRVKLINLIYICILYLLQFLFIQSVLQSVPGTFFPPWQVLLTSSCIYQRTAIMLALTNQAVTSVPVPADMNWILMENLALVRNMNQTSSFFALENTLMIRSMLCIVWLVR